MILKIIQYIGLISMSITSWIVGIKSLVYAIFLVMDWWFNNNYITKIASSVCISVMIIIGITFMIIPFYLPWPFNKNRKNGGKKDERN